MSGESDGLELGVLAGTIEDGTPTVEPTEGAAVDCVVVGIIVEGAPPVDPTEGALESEGVAAEVEARAAVDCDSDGTAVLED